jgi:2-polyprenyl-6-hydroxyphenyl methylase / 3-demethylubiquinone-9 3-methyltransferase
MRPMSTQDAAEIQKFDQVASQWWDERGPFKPLHRLNPVRLEFIRGCIEQAYAPQSSSAPFEGLHMVDVGCGGGLITEPLARLGAAVEGIDASREAIQAATAHAKLMGLPITYQQKTVEALAAEGCAYDVVLALEIVEHVADVPLFLRSCAQLVKPGGLLFLSTLNRTLKSFLLGIVAAEYVLRWVPRGTHQWERFIKPAELVAHASSFGLAPLSMKGLEFKPLTGQWALSSEVDVNYLLCMRK